MSENTKIEWADSSWSPWRGCTKVSSGCANCYAETLSKRNPAVLGQWGKGKPRVLAKNWGDPVKWNRAATSHWPPVQFIRPRVFPSLCDWLDDEVPIEWLARFLKLIHATPQLDWLLLTKRPELWMERIELARNASRIKRGGAQISTAVSVMLNHWLSGTPLANVWVGTSVEDQPNADRRIPELLKIPARLRFLSVEPMLGPIDCDLIEINHSTPEIHWVIVGGESGPGARPCNAEWIRELIRQCAAAKVPCFVKQIGSNPVRGSNDEPFERIVNRAKYDEDHHKAVPYHPKGGDPAEWPEDFRVRQMPEVKP